ncbi:hypothetical protein OG906_34115 [Streptomyces sp. NBC_01426]|uniref:hypothetical protein n=1 Tax=Streptomyces sp. NBC_01426 TaxID=2975866 RepID=UPI002E33A68B|nr:hypothetical protein [Streptomyces sp. NBC_01426]
MTIKKMTAAVLLTTATVGAGMVTAVPASAGGVGDFLSPAFGTDCANLNTGAQAAGHTTRGSGAAGGSLLGLPIGTPLNQCGGADMPVQKTLINCENSQAGSSLVNKSSVLGPCAQVPADGGILGG